MFFRAFFAIPPLTNGDGLPTNALYGFLNMTLKLLREVQDDYVVYCFDRKDKSFRFDLYGEYKANRAEMPDDLAPQIPYIYDITDKMGITRIDKERYEADDVIGSLTKWGRKHDLDVVIVSGDKDFAQLVKPHVVMYDTMKDVKYDEDGVRSKWNVEPSQMIDYLAMVGDSSDNVPGIKGIGPKGAEKLLKDYGSLDGIYENIDKISAKALKQKLIDNKEMAYLSQKLVTIVCDLDLVKDPHDLELKKINKEELKSLLDFLGFKTFSKNLSDDKLLSGKGPSGGDKTAKAPGTTPKLEIVKEDLSDLPNFEESTVSLSKLNEMVEPYSEIWAINSEQGFLLGTGKKLLRVEAATEEIGEILSHKKLQWKGFDLKAVWHLMGISDPRADWDAQLAAYVLNPGNTETLSDVYSKFVGEPWPPMLSSGDLYKIHLGLERTLCKALKADHGDKVLREIELPLVPVLYEMERRGILIDTVELDEQATLLSTDIKRLEHNIHDAAGGEFNVGSPKQLGEVLFEKLNLTKGKKTKTGYSTSSDVLEKLKSEHKIIEMIIEYRELAKLKSTYVDALPHLINPTDGRVHTNFRQAATTTGRLSSVNPNLQNIPIRTERGRRVRKAFIAPQDQVLLSVDYSQVELRVLAHMAGDEGLIRAFANDQDIHTATAAEVFGLKLSEVTSEQRRKAKAVNFGIAYGQGAFGLSEALGISRKEASEIIERYFMKFNKVKGFMDSIIEKAKGDGFVEMLSGRRRYIPELKSSNQMLRKFGERAAINAPIQGTASDLVKMAMIKLREEVSLPMILQVHDELLFEGSPGDIEDNKDMIQAVMENTTKLNVPLKVNLATGKNWDEAHS